MLGLIFALALASQPPAPSGVKVGSHQQAQTTNSQSAAQFDKRGTEQSPLVVKLRTPKEADQEAADASDYAKEEATNNGRLLVITAVLAVLAALQWAAMLWQAIILNRQTNAVEREFLATHRPKIRVRQFRNTSRNAGENFEIHFVCANVGDSPCDVLEISYQTRARKILTATDEMERPILVPGKYKKVLLHPNTRLAAGELCPFQTELFKKLEWSGDKDWEFAGYVRYRDDRKIERLTGFWQRFDRLGFPIATPDDPNFRYED